MTRDEYVDLIKSTALDLGSRFAMRYLIARFSFIALPIIGPIVEWAVGYILRIAIRETEMGAFFAFIDTRTNQQGVKFTDAAIRNRIAQTTGSAEDKIKAEQELIDSFRAFVKLTN